MGRGDGNAARGEQRAVSSVGAGLELGREFFCQLMRHGGLSCAGLPLISELGSDTQYPASVYTRATARLERRRATQDSLDPAAPRAWCARALVV